MKTKDLQCALSTMAPENLNQASDMLRTLAHPARLQIVDLLHTAGPLPVGEIMDYLDLAQSAASQHLNHMRRTGLLKSERRGKEVWYTIADARPIALLNCICSCCETNISTDKLEVNSAQFSEGSKASPKKRESRTSRPSQSSVENLSSTRNT